MLSINESHMAVPTKKLQSLIAFLGQTLHCTLHSSSDIVIKLLVLVNFSASVSQSCITFGTSRKQTYIICCLSAFLRCSSRKPRSFRLSPVLSRGAARIFLRRGLKLWKQKPWKGKIAC